MHQWERKDLDEGEQALIRSLLREIEFEEILRLISDELEPADTKIVCKEQFGSSKDPELQYDTKTMLTADQRRKRNCSERARTSCEREGDLVKNHREIEKNVSVPDNAFGVLSESQLEKIDLSHIWRRKRSRRNIITPSTHWVRSQLNKQLSPPPFLVDVQHVAAEPSLLCQENGCKNDGQIFVGSVSLAGSTKISEDRVEPRKPMKQLCISGSLMESFLRVAHDNTRDNLETCGVLAGTLIEEKLCMTTIIIPKQQATAYSCSTLEEQEIVDFQEKNGLRQFGWIHTHPSQRCFMSSIDLHTHFIYQVLFPEAIAIVMAPTDSTRKFGIFRLTEPNGMETIKSCDKSGFHNHTVPKDRAGIYQECGHVYLDAEMQCEVVDLR